jgi:hypothetical protein
MQFTAKVQGARSNRRDYAVRDLRLATYSLFIPGDSVVFTTATGRDISFDKYIRYQRLCNTKSRRVARTEF